LYYVDDPHITRPLVRPTNQRSASTLSTGRAW
jgi:hypothetical protein